MATAWLSLDEDDHPDVFGNYLARAFQHAGVDLRVLGADDVWVTSQFSRQFGMLARAVEEHAAPCVLVLDELERLPSPTVGLLDVLLRRSPSNLHLVLAWRSNPGVDLMPAVLDGSALVVEAERLRFKRAEIARLHGGSLSRAELASIGERTAGWPVAVMIDRNTRTGGAGALAGSDAPDFSADFVGVRLLRGMSQEDRASLFDLAVFDWVGQDVVDEVLGSSDTRLRTLAFPQLDGLFLPSAEDPNLLRLHPLVKEYCVDRLAIENPERKRFLHRRISEVLAGRGHNRRAWRHAAHAGDAQLLGALIERSGVYRLWLREGADGVDSANKFLTPEIIAAFPRLALLRCVQLNFDSEFSEAEALYERVRRATQGFTRDREGGDDLLLVVDHVFVDAMLTGGRRARETTGFDPLLPPGGAPVRLSERDRMVLGGSHLLRCMFRCQFADFDRSREHGVRAKAFFSGALPQGEFFASVYLGIGAMAQGRVSEALDSYQRARRIVQKSFPSDWRLAASVDLLMMELDLERNRERAIRQRTLKDLTNLRGVWNEIFAVAVRVRSQLTRQMYGGDAAITYLAGVRELVRGSAFKNLAIHTALLSVYELAGLGRVEEAADIWRKEALPCELPELVAVEGRSWRRMEVLWSARVALLAAQGDYEPALELAEAGRQIAADYGVTRQVLRFLGLSMAVAHRAGQEERALGALAGSLRLLRGVDYYGALASEADVSTVLLRKFLATNREPDLRDAAQAALEHLGERSKPSAEFSPRELDVLAEVRNGLRNREIADFLGITEEGVRFHLRNIYRKTRRSSRHNAVRYAESKGLLR